MTTTVKNPADEYTTWLTKLTDTELSKETRNALSESYRADAASTDAAHKVRACQNETQRRRKAFIYDYAVIDVQFGPLASAQIRAAAHTHQVA
jgi:hypothetical protein